jgi:hypothetical protein
MPYISDDVECAEVHPGSSTHPAQYCTFLMEDQECYLCEKNTARPYYILLKAGRGEEIVVFHSEQFVDAITHQAGLPQRQKADYALLGQYRDRDGNACAAVVFLELVDDLNSPEKLQHKVDQCDSAYEFFCREGLNFQAFHAQIPGDIYRVFGDFRRHVVVGAVAPRKYNIARGKPHERRLKVYQLDAALFVDRRSAKAMHRGRGRNVNLEQPRAVSLRDLLDEMGCKAK